MKKVLVATASVCLLIGGCGNNNSRNHTVDYQEAEGYFVRNDVNAGHKLEKITSQQQFESIFGMATTMSNKPTEIDFSNNMAIGLILPETNDQTRIITDSLVWKNNHLNLYYSTESGQPTGFTTRPAIVLVIDKKYNGIVETFTNQTRQIIADGHNARNSVDYTGRYKGTIPCADCSGIEVEINLNEDGTYTKSMKYIGKEPDNIFNTSGRYEWDNTGSKITLTGETEPDMYFVGEGRLFMLDQDGNNIQGDLADLYVLDKQ